MKKPKNKRWLAASLALLVVMSCSSFVLATGLEKGKDNYYHYVLADGSYVKNGWRTIDGYKYYFNSLGNMVTGFFTINGDKYYFDANGRKIGRAHV